MIYLEYILVVSTIACTRFESDGSFMYQIAHVCDSLKVWSKTRFRLSLSAKPAPLSSLPGSRALDEAIDVDSEAYGWRRSGFFWCMRASLGLACAQASTLSSQVFGKGNPRSRAGSPGAHVFEPLHLTPDP